ncbi:MULTISPECIES: DNA glycosylase AlkZ-like family protein [Actinotignum]|uniref:DNA glycosylase AlkZ-like family protein n=1 Tax=Actinotignum TaxID=1653174 RepID=UPI00255033EB|nr:MULTISPECIES: crosslink repair DNA glycosylase YcaQ family protein [Actinotignum]MDE1536135.1 crosslink repair DNA glycosylase YcaQ family protein [Actinotignum schaalii]MDK7270940.1 crosslink repair DNA glycosylase YcaQ family protein [Actinotignum schaalii]MDY5130733.1 crosslink repair DNA glycosylase YcaQ family protein [Actinotignum timonense]MDY5150017.1 crosslink repair DNA glycosylase YcaQ family protein [Actinotignum timonense]
MVNPDSEPRYRIDIATARKIAVTAQGLAPEARSAGASVADVFQRLGCVQIDSLQAVRRSQELVLLARGVDKDSLPLLHESSTGLFETWGHAHSLMPRSIWPLLHWRRRRIKQYGLSGPQVDQGVARAVLERIRENGPTAHSQLGCAVGQGWERSSPVKTACEWLLSIGDLAVISRDEKWQRIYCTPEQAGLPSSELLDEDTSLNKTVALALRALGIARFDDVVDYFRFPKSANIRERCCANGYVPVEVRGLAGTWLADEALVEELHNASWETGSITLLSPFDSLIWTRSRQRELFGKDYRLEAYKPAHKREFGYFGMPILCDERIIGRVAARVKDGHVAIENLEVDEGFSPEGIRSEITSLLESWVN